MYSNPEKFRDFVAKCACICFTATPDDQVKDGMDAKVLKAMTFARYNYILNAAEQSFKRHFEEQYPAMSLQDKAAVVEKHAAKGPVLVYCDK